MLLQEELRSDSRFWLPAAESNPNDEISSRQWPYPTYGRMLFAV